MPYAFENRRLIEESQKLFPEEGKRVLPCVMVDPMRSTDAQAAELIKTPLTSVWMESRANDLLNRYEKTILLGHVGKAEDCAGAVTFLCSPAASYITGEIIVIDGGLTTSQIGKR